MEKNTEFWEKARDEAIEECTAVWPHIVKMRAQLNELELTHGEHELRRLEAERHLVEVVKVGKKHKALNMVEAIAKLSPEQRVKLYRVLDKAAEIMEEQDHV